MFDLVVTIALIYFAYRAYGWYQSLRNQAGSGGVPLREVRTDERGEDPIVTQPGDENDYIEYEEIKEPNTETRANER